MNMYEYIYTKRLFKNQVVIFALFCSAFGFHKFYLRKNVQGVLCILFCWTLIPSIIGFFEGIYYLCMSQDTFNLKYNYHIR